MKVNVRRFVVPMVFLNQIRTPLAYINLPTTDVHNGLVAGLDVSRSNGTWDPVKGELTITSGQFYMQNVEYLRYNVRNVYTIRTWGDSPGSQLYLNDVLTHYGKSVDNQIVPLTWYLREGWNVVTNTGGGGIVISTPALSDYIP